MQTMISEQIPPLHLVYQLIDGISDAIVVVDRQWRFTYVNNKAEKYLKIGKHLLLGRNVWTIFPQLADTAFKARYLKIMRDKESAEFEEYFEPLNMWFDVRALPAPEGIIVYFRDISKRKQLAQLKSALNNIQAAVTSTLDLEHIMEHVVVQAARALGGKVSSSICIRADDKWVFKYIYGLPDYAKGLVLKDEQIPRPKSNQQQRDQILVVRGADERNPKVWETMQRFNISACLVLPLVERGKIFGLLFFNAHDGDDTVFGDAEIDFAYRVAASVAMAIQNARLYQAERDAVASLDKESKRLRELLESFEGQILERTRALRFANKLLEIEIMERKRVEEALRRSEARFRMIFDKATISMFLVDLEQNLLESNRAFQELLGYSAQELCGCNFVDFTHPDDVQRSCELYQNLINGTISHYHLEKRYISKNGSILWVRVNISLVQNEEGQPFTLAMVEDITSRKQAEEELEHFFNLSHDILCIQGLDGCFKRLNPAFEKTLGYAENELVGRQASEYVYPEDGELFQAELDKLRQGHPSYYELRFRCKDDDYKWLAWTAVPILEKNLLYTVACDITERKRIKAEMARLDRLNLVGQIAASIGHEVRNPMTTVRGFLQMLGKKQDCSSYRHYFKLMIEELDRANAIITEFLSLAKNKAVHLQQYNLNSILEAMLPLMQANAIAHDKYVEAELDPTVPPLYLDEKEIRQLVLNLVRNGLEAMSAGGKVHIRTYAENGEVVMAVADNGPGLAPEILERIGTPFLTTKETGTGLGLPVCYSIAARHKAHIAIDTGSEGTTFFVRFSIGET